MQVSAETHVPNIGHEGVRKRRNLGIAMLLVGAAGLAVLILADVALAWRLVLIPFWLLGFSGLLQAREKT
jgi:hypothetical protein